jgi:single-strand DNA-binding protein
MYDKNSLNLVVLIGNLGKNPELKYTSNGVAVCNISLATNKEFTGSDGKKRTETEWHKLTLWRSSAEFAEKYLHKGDKVNVLGSIKTDSWVDDDGNRRYSTKVVVDKITPIMSIPKEDIDIEPDSSDTPIEEKEEEKDDQLPF